MGSPMLLFVFFTFVIYTVCAEDGESPDFKLLKYLDKKSNPGLRPVNNISETVGLRFGLALIRLMDMDEHSNSLTTQVWLRTMWKDRRMTWDTKEFGTDMIHYPIEKLWKPDMVLYNAADQGALPYQEADTILSSDGTVLWIPPMILKSSCIFDMTRYPFDTQTCSLKFGSWTWHGFNLDPDFYDGLEQIDITDYILSNDWRLLSNSAKKNVKYYPCCVEPYPDLTFTLTMQRIGGLHSLVFIFPIVIIAVLMPFIFLIPHSQFQRYTLGGLLVVCLMVMLGRLEPIFVSSQLTVPFIAAYYFVVVILLTLGLILSVITSNLADCSNSPPNIIKKVFVDWLGYICCVRSAAKADPEEGSTEKKQTNNASEWYLVAKVLDRLFFVIYVVLTIILSLAFLV